MHINTIINKDMPVHSQLYIEAKKQIFSNWEDDIIEEIPVVEIKSEVE